MMNKDLKTIILSIVIIILGFCSPHISLKIILVIFGALLFLGSFSNYKKSSKKKKKTMDGLTNNNLISESNDKNNEPKERILKEEIDILLDKFNNTFYNENKAYINNYCPNCGVVYEKKINSSRSCKECKKSIHIYTNKIDKSKYLIGQERFSEFLDYKYKIDEIMFYEKLLNSLSKSTNTIIKEVKKAREDCKSGIVRDIVWIALNSSRNYYQIESTKQIMKCYEIKDFVDKLVYFDNNCRHSLFYYERFQYGMYEVADYKNQYEVAQESFVTYIYHSIVDHMLYYGFNDIADIDYEGIYTYCYPRLIQIFMEKYDMSLEEFEKLFKERARNHFIGGLSKDEALSLIEGAIKWSDNLPY